MVYSIRKDFAPYGSKVFSYRVDPFHKGQKSVLAELSPLKMFQFPLWCLNKKGKYGTVNIVKFQTIFALLFL